MGVVTLDGANDVFVIRPSSGIYQSIDGVKQYVPVRPTDGVLQVYSAIANAMTNTANLPAACNNHPLILAIKAFGRADMHQLLGNNMNILGMKTDTFIRNIRGVAIENTIYDANARGNMFARYYADVAALFFFKLCRRINKFCERMLCQAHGIAYNKQFSASFSTSQGTEDSMQVVKGIKTRGSKYSSGGMAPAIKKYLKGFTLVFFSTELLERSLTTDFNIRTFGAFNQSKAGSLLNSLLSFAVIPGGNNAVEIIGGTTFYKIGSGRKRGNVMLNNNVNKDENNKRNKLFATLFVIQVGNQVGTSTVSDLTTNVRDKEPWTTRESDAVQQAVMEGKNREIYRKYQEIFETYNHANARPQQ